MTSERPPGVPTTLDLAIAKRALLDSTDAFELRAAGRTYWSAYDYVEAGHGDLPGPSRQALWNTWERLAAYAPSADRAWRVWRTSGAQLSFNNAEDAFEKMNELAFTDAIALEDAELTLIGGMIIAYWEDDPEFSGGVGRTYISVEV